MHEKKKKCTIYSLLNHWRQHPHHPMWCHIVHQTLGACSPFWTTRPLIFLGLLFSAMVYQNVSLIQWSKIKLWRLIHFKTRLRLSTFSTHPRLEVANMQFFTGTKGFILRYVHCQIAYTFSLIENWRVFPSTASNSGCILISELGTSKICVDLSYITNAGSMEIPIN
jgi:hypothetical protein